MARISRLNDAFTRILELEASPVVGKQLHQKDRKRRKRKGLEMISAHAQAKMP